MKKISITGEYIKLDSFLKFVGNVQTGGQAKSLIKTGNVMVDGEICLERGRKIREGNIVKINDEEYEVYTSCT